MSFFYITFHLFTFLAYEFYFLSYSLITKFLKALNFFLHFTDFKFFGNLHIDHHISATSKFISNLYHIYNFVEDPWFSYSYWLFAQSLIAACGKRFRCTDAEWWLAARDRPVVLMGVVRSFLESTSPWPESPKFLNTRHMWPGLLRELTRYFVRFVSEVLDTTRWWFVVSAGCGPYGFLGRFLVLNHRY